MNNPDVTILNTFSEFKAMFDECLEHNTFADLPEALFHEVLAAVDSRNVYGKPLEEVPIPDGFEALRDEEGKIVYRIAQYMDLYVPVAGIGALTAYEIPKHPRIIVRKKPTVVAAHPKDSPCVVVTKKATYRKTGECRRVTYGESYALREGGYIYTWQERTPSIHDYPIYELVKEEETTAA